MAENNKRSSIGRFEWKIGSTCEGASIYIFDGDTYDTMVDDCKKYMEDYALSNGFAKCLLGSTLPNPELTHLFSANEPRSVYHVKTQSGEPHIIYHLDDCTIQLFRDFSNNLAYLIVINKDYTKREAALKQLEEIFV